MSLVLEAYKQMIAGGNEITNVPGTKKPVSSRAGVTGSGDLQESYGGADDTTATGGGVNTDTTSTTSVSAETPALSTGAEETETSLGLPVLKEKSGIESLRNYVSIAKGAGNLVTLAFKGLEKLGISSPEVSALTEGLGQVSKYAGAAGAVYDVATGDYTSAAKTAVVPALEYAGEQLTAYGAEQALLAAGDYALGAGSTAAGTAAVGETASVVGPMLSSGADALGYIALGYTASQLPAMLASNSSPTTTDFTTWVNDYYTLKADYEAKGLRAPTFAQYRAVNLTPSEGNKEAGFYVKRFEDTLSSPEYTPEFQQEYGWAYSNQPQPGVTSSMYKTRLSLANEYYRGGAATEDTEDLYEDINTYKGYYVKPGERYVSNKSQYYNF